MGDIFSIFYLYLSNIFIKYFKIKQPNATTYFQRRGFHGTPSTVALAHLGSFLTPDVRHGAQREQPVTD